MEVNSYPSQAESSLKEYIGKPICLVYDLAQLISAVYFKCYSSFSNIQWVEWSNRAISTVHALFVTAMSLYFVFSSDLRTGRRYFPHCSEVVDKFLDYDWSYASFLEKGTSEEQKLKRACLMELKEDVKKAFYKDMAKKNCSGLLSSSSSSSYPKEGLKCKGRKR